MKRWLTFALLVALAAVTPARTATNGPVVVPVPRTDRNSQLAHEQLLAKAR